MKRSNKAMAAPLAAAAILAIGAVGCQNAATTTPPARTSSAPATASRPAATAPATPSPTPAATLPQGSGAVTLDPADFVASIDNPYWPMKPGSHWVFRETDGDGAVFKVEITVMKDTKDIVGIASTVVHDQVTEDGALVEDTIDWYAQDSSGNIWYMGEDTKEYENGKVVSTAGSWEAGVNGAQPGIVVLGLPAPGLSYRQEYLKGEAEDGAEVLSVDERVDVPLGTYENVMLTKDYTALEPAVLEYKFYAKGVGPVLVLSIAGGSGREELITFEPGR